MWPRKHRKFSIGWRAEMFECANKLPDKLRMNQKSERQLDHVIMFWPSRFIILWNEMTCHHLSPCRFIRLWNEMPSYHLTISSSHHHIVRDLIRLPFLAMISRITISSRTISPVWRCSTRISRSQVRWLDHLLTFSHIFHKLYSKFTRLIN
jgi:hypothetical protein